MAAQFDLSILILTEDTSTDGHTTIERLLKASFKLLVVGCQTQRIDFQPQSTLGQGVHASRANLWKSSGRASRQSLVSLRRSIATKLMESSVPGFVVFHFDGDRVWADQESSENRQKFQSQIVGPVRQLLSRNGHEPDGALSRLLPMVPFYSIEAWLFQNLTILRKLLREQHGGRDLDQLTKWASDRGQLDELPQPKNSICCGAKHNGALAVGFPAEKVLDVGKSYEQTVEHLLACEDLTAALEQTRTGL